MSWLKAQTNHADPNSLAARFRRRRAAHLMALCREILERKGACRIIDLGGKISYWTHLPEALKDERIHITVVNLESGSTGGDPRFRFVQGDATRVDMPDMSFDLAHSNSVVEHLGSWQAMERFATETRRLAPAYYVQTPYFWFPFEPHMVTPFFHWLPESVRVAMLLRGPRGHIKQARSVAEAVATVDSHRLLDQRMLRYLFPDGEMVKERMLLVKSLTMIRRPA